MRLIGLKFLFVVLAVLFSAGGGYGASCSKFEVFTFNDKALWTYAADWDLKADSIVWSKYYPAHIKEAKRRGLTYGVPSAKSIPP